MKIDQDAPDPQFNATTARLLRREAVRRAAEELNTTSGPGLEGALARISAEVTEEAACRRTAATGTGADLTDPANSAGSSSSRMPGSDAVAPLSAAGSTGADRDGMKARHSHSGCPLLPVHLRERGQPS